MRDSDVTSQSKFFLYPGVYSGLGYRLYPGHIIPLYKNYAYFMYMYLRVRVGVKANSSPNSNPKPLSIYDLS